MIVRAMIREFEHDVRLVLETLAPQTPANSVGLLGVPVSGRGFGIVKERNCGRTRNEGERYRA